MNRTLSQSDMVELIPWDPNNEQQFQRMVDQRHACGWCHDEIDLWKENMLNNEKFLWWVVSLHIQSRPIVIEEPPNMSRD